MPGPTRVPMMLLALTASISLAGCGGSSGTGAVTQPTTSSTTSAPPATGGSALTIASFAYDPTPLTVAPGAKIPVANHDSAQHTVTSDANGLFLADDIGGGKTVTFTAPSKPGTYTFHCQYHSSMHGTLIVK